METYTMTRPSMLLPAACAPSAAPPVATVPVALLAADVALLATDVALLATEVALLVTERAPISRVHQVQVQAELARKLVLTGGINGTTGFRGASASSKRYTDGGSGLPPRGRPV